MQENRVQLNFWHFQVAGWMAYGLAMTIGSIAYFDSFLHALRYKFTMVAVGFPITVALRYLYRSKGFNALPVIMTAVLAIFCSFLASLLMSVVFNWIQIQWFDKEPGSFYSLFKGSMERSFLFISWSALYMGIRYWMDLQNQKAKAINAQALAHQAQLQMLRYQLNPHFLFNALNTINALIPKDSAKAEQVTNELSEFLRYTLTSHGREWVTLREETAAIANFLHIQKIRFEDKLEVRFTIDDAVADFPIPAFLIHPLVENAVKYGMQSDPPPLQIEVQAKPTKTGVTIKVVNSGTWAPEPHPLTPNDKGTGLGLKNIRSRLELYFPNRHRFQIGPTHDTVSAIIEIDRETGP